MTTEGPFFFGVAWTVAGLLLVLGVTGLAKRVGWSAPLVLVAVGVGAAFLPFTPDVRLEPEVVLVGVLPALLFAAALQTSFLEVRQRGDAIVALSVGLVLFSVVTIGLATTWLVGLALPGVGFTLAAGLALGAILAPTDAVSVGALAGSGKLPRRLAALLEGEGLLNDATALVALNTAIIAIVSPSAGFSHVFIDFGRAVLGGAGVGVVVAAVIAFMRRRLKAPVLDTSLSLATPYVAYLPAALIQGSGFLSVVLTGIWLGYRVPTFRSAESRIAERINWRTVSFLLENAVFLLIGLQLPSIVAAAARTRIGFLPGLLVIAGIYLAMVAARFVWVFATTALYRFGPERLRERRWDWRTATAISFAGVRGVVTLAAVFLLPSERTPIVGFLQLAAFVIVVVSLLQGLALAPLVRLLRLPLPNPDQDRVQIRTLVAEAQTAAVERLEREATEDDPQELVASLRQSAEYRVLIGATDESGLSQQPDAYSRLRLLMLDSERKAVLAARQEGRYEESVITAVLGDFDSIEMSLKRSRRRDLPHPVAAPLQLPLHRRRRPR